MRTMRTDGNLAIQPAYKPSYQPKVSDLKKKAKFEAERKQKAKAKNLNIAVAVFYIVLIFAVAFCIVSREVSIYEKNSQVNRLENQLEQAVSETKQAQIASEKAINLKTVEEVATSKFAMSRPEKSQTVYINIQQSDYAEKTAKKKFGTELQEGIQSSIKNLFGIFGIN